MTEATLWDRQDFPVLKAAVDALLDQQQPMGLRVSELASTTGFSDAEVLASLRRLEGDGCLELRLTMPTRASRVVRALGPALRILGHWPTPETFADRMIAALEEIAENTDSEDTRSRTRKILAGFAGSGRQIAVGVGTTLITGAIQ